jgi:hypothetical protein
MVAANKEAPELMVKLGVIISTVLRRDQTAMEYLSHKWPRNVCCNHNPVSSSFTKDGTNGVGTVNPSGAPELSSPGF